MVQPCCGSSSVRASPALGVGLVVPRKPPRTGRCVIAASKRWGIATEQLYAPLKHTTLHGVANLRLRELLNQLLIDLSLGESDVLNEAPPTIHRDEKVGEARRRTGRLLLIGREGRIEPA